ncbi:D-tyrosyl-tRNA(Tyr) deacylase [bacterium]|nr:D-tyrosyl-tRNA(Tyr) deacylase [bacterium]
MRALIQKVSQANVKVDGEIRGSIGRGFLILLGVGQEDTTRQADWLADKVVHLRVFEDDQGKMNLSLLEVGGEALVVSQFTLFADCRKGRRPSFSQAARPEAAVPLYEHFVAKLQSLLPKVATGVFQTHMDVSLTNDGPVTLWLDTADLG